MRILLTGHKGYIGAVAGPILRAAGHAVGGFDADLFGGCDFGAPGEEFPEIQKDIRDVTVKDLRGFDAVVHLAALPNEAFGNPHSSSTSEISHQASVRLAELAKAAGVKRFVLSSSCDMYSAAGDEFSDETVSLNSAAEAREPRILAERDLARMADSGFSPTVLRIATAYGVSSRLRLDVLLNELVARACTTGRIHVGSDGWRPLVHVRDITAAILAVLEAPQEAIHNEIFNVGSTEENYRLSELAAMVAEVVPGSDLEHAPAGELDKCSCRMNCSKLGRVLTSFRPQWTARMGVQELYDAYRACGLTLEDLESGRYARSSHIQRLLNSQQMDATLRLNAPEMAGKL